MAKRGVPRGTVNNPRGVNQFCTGKGTGEKNAQLTMRLSDADKQKLKEAAQRRGMTLSNWLLEVALEAAEKKLELLARRK
jgi:uncharacterized protein (DUF1778 family)